MPLWTIDAWPSDSVCGYGSSQGRDWPDQPHLHYVLTEVNRKAKTGLITLRPQNCTKLVGNTGCDICFFQDQLLSKLENKIFCYICMLFWNQVSKDLGFEIGTT
jgi:hypothetical protein